MRDLEVRWTPRARREAERIARWWIKNREAAPELFEKELWDALEFVKAAPEGGSVYPQRGPYLIRRVLLRRTRHHLYYREDESAELLWVLAVWHASRRRGPVLR